MTAAGPGSHSPVGGSGAKRIRTCPGSVALSVGCDDEESDHAALGTAVHALIEHCFRTGTEGWMHIGRRVFNGTVQKIPDHVLVDATEAGLKILDTEEGIAINKTMAIGAQTMLDAVRAAHATRNQDNFWVERRFHCPTIHKLFFGTSDVVCIEDTEAGPVLHIWDYKNGVTLVEAFENDQGCYYACGALEDLELWGKVDKVVIHIVQPNGFHWAGPVREWETTPDYLVEWLEDGMVPAINLATRPGPKQVVSGSHCVFCPARAYACPALTQDVKELETMLHTIEKEGAEALSEEFLARYLDLSERADIALKAAKKTAFSRMMAGKRLPGYKLMHGKTNRVWKDTVTLRAPDGTETTRTIEQHARITFGDAAFTKPELKSPAKIEELAMGKDFSTRCATKPDGGLRIGKASEAATEISVDTKAMFKPVAKKPDLKLVS